MRHLSAVVLVLIFSIAFVSCRKSGQDEHHENQEAETPQNEDTDPLYDEVMKLHDEGMDKMDEIYALKDDLKKKIAAVPELASEKKKDIEARISQLDSAGRSMMIWMRNFHPENDSLDDQSYHEYLESEMQRVKKVRDDILAAIERAKEE
jgi:hypothetical protein